MDHRPTCASVLVATPMPGGRGPPVWEALATSDSLACTLAASEGIPASSAASLKPRFSVHQGVYLRRRRNLSDKLTADVEHVTFTESHRGKNVQKRLQARSELLAGA